METMQGNNVRPQRTSTLLTSSRDKRCLVKRFSAFNRHFVLMEEGDKLDEMQFR